MIRKNISIEKAKQILALKSEGFTDKQINNILNTLYALCDQVVNSLEKGKQ